MNKTIISKSINLTAKLPLEGGCGDVCVCGCVFRYASFIPFPVDPEPWTFGEFI